MKKSGNNNINADIALRRLADCVGKKWYRMLAEDCSGLGHIHDLWNEMYRDMESIVVLEKYIVSHSDEVSGVDFGDVVGFIQYIEEVE